MDWTDRRWTEADVVVELVHRLKLAGENIRCEVKLPSSGHRSGFMRVDVVIIRENKIAFAIEVKDNLPTRHYKPADGRRQDQAYWELEGAGVPVIWVHGMEAIGMALETVKRFDGIPDVDHVRQFVWQRSPFNDATEAA